MGLLEKTWNWVTRNPAIAALITAVIAALFIIAIGGGSLAIRLAQQRDEANSRADEARRTRHAHQIASAIAAYREHDLIRATDILEQIPPALRNGWEYHYLRRLSTVSVVKLEMPLPLDGTKAVFSRDNKRLAVWDQIQDSIMISDTTTGARIATIRSENAKILQVAFTADSNHVVARLDNSLAKVLKADTGKEVITVQAALPEMRSVDFGRDGKLFLTLGNEAVQIWDVSTSRQQRAFMGDFDDARFAPDMCHILTVSGSNCDIINIPTGNKISAPYQSECANLPSRISSISPHAVAQHRRASGRDKGTTNIGSDRRMTIDVLGPREGFRSMKFTTDDMARVAVSERKTGNLILSAFVPEYRTLPTILALSQDGFHWAARKNEDVIVYHASSTEDFKCLQAHTARVTSVAFSPDGKNLASADDLGTVLLWNSCETPTPLLGCDRPALCVTFSPKGESIACAGGVWDEKNKQSKQGLLTLWDSSNGKKVRTIEEKLLEFNLCCAISPDGNKIITSGFWAGDEGILGRGATFMFDLHSGKKEDWLGGVTLSLAFSPDGKQIAFPTRLLGAKQPRTETELQWKHILAFRETKSDNAYMFQDQDFEALAFSPDGRRIACGYQGKIAVFDAINGGQLISLVGHTGRVNGLSFSSDSTRIISGSADGTVRVWDAQGGQELLTLTGHTDSVNSVAISSDGMRIASGSSDKTVRIWDASQP